MTSSPAAKVRLLQFGSSYEIGLTNQEVQLAKAYSQIEQIDLLVLSGERQQISGCRDQLQFAGIRHEQIDGLDDHKQIIRLMREFGSTVERFSPDIVTVNTNWQLIIAGISRLCSAKKYKIIYTVHGFRHNYPIRSIVARILIGLILMLFADLINTPTSYVERSFPFLAPRRLKKIPLGEDDCFFRAHYEPEFTQHLNFCFPGEFRKGKNQDMLIRAFRDYIDKSGNHRSLLFLPGKGPLHEHCIRLADSLGLSSNVIFPGQLNRNEMLDLYSRCQVAIIPTNKETFGHCVAEPLILGMLVISRPVGIARDVIIDDRNGFLFRNRQELLSKMLLIARSEPPYLSSVSACARSTGLQFQWKSIAERHLVEMFIPLLEGISSTRDRAY